MNIYPKYIFIFLCFLFLAYSFSIYINPIKLKSMNSTNIAEGRLIWQKYNCQSCHQLFNLGGYLGPDITNIISQPHKGENFIIAMIQSGNKQMPAFHLSKMEINLLLEFLKSVDSIGNSDPRKLKLNNLGMIEKNEN